MKIAKILGFILRIPLLIIFVVITPIMYLVYLARDEDFWLVNRQIKQNWEGFLTLLKNGNRKRGTKKTCRKNKRA